VLKPEPVVGWFAGLLTLVAARKGMLGGRNSTDDLLDKICDIGRRWLRRLKRKRQERIERANVEPESYPSPFGSVPIGIAPARRFSAINQCEALRPGSSAPLRAATNQGQWPAPATPAV
jgi:hypothetical protein